MASASQLQSAAHNKMFVKVDHLILKLLNPPFFFLEILTFDLMASCKALYSVHL